MGCVKQAFLNVHAHPEWTGIVEEVRLPKAWPIRARGRRISHAAHRQGRTPHRLPPPMPAAKAPLRVDRNSYVWPTPMLHYREALKCQLLPNIAGPITRAGSGGRRLGPKADFRTTMPGFRCRKLSAWQDSQFWRGCPAPRKSWAVAGLGSSFANCSAAIAPSMTLWGEHW